MRDMTEIPISDDRLTEAVYVALALQELGMKRYEAYLVDRFLQFTDALSEHPEIQARLNELISEGADAWSAYKEQIAARTQRRLETPTSTWWPH